MGHRVGLPEAGPRVYVTGEAVAVDLGKRGYLFALLRSATSVDDAYRIVYKSFPWPEGPGGQHTTPGILYYNALRGSAPVPPSARPMLVRIVDIDNPSAVELVDPDNLAATFGEGANLVEAKIELIPTSIPISHQLETRFPWLTEWRQRKKTFFFIINYPKYDMKIRFSDDDFVKS